MVCSLREYDSWAADLRSTAAERCILSAADFRAGQKSDGNSRRDHTADRSGTDHSRKNGERDHWKGAGDRIS